MDTDILVSFVVLRQKPSGRRPQAMCLSTSSCTIVAMSVTSIMCPQQHLDGNQDLVRLLSHLQRPSFMPSSPITTVQPPRILEISPATITSLPWSGKFRIRLCGAKVPPRDRSAPRPSCFRWRRFCSVGCWNTSRSIHALHHVQYPSEAWIEDHGRACLGHRFSNVRALGAQTQYPLCVHLTSVTRYTEASSQQYSQAHYGDQVLGSGGLSKRRNVTLTPNVRKA